MATIIDALVVTLGLDPSGFKKGQSEVNEGLKKTKDEADKTAKDMEAAGKRAASFFGSIRTELLALVGVTLSAQGIKTFITSMTSNLLQLAINSKALDISAKSLDGWQRAAEGAGSSAEKITATLSSFQDVLTQIRTGGGQDNPLFGALASFAGATGANFDYLNDNSEEIMKKISANWGKLNKDAQRRFGGMFGFDNATQQGLSSGQLVVDAERYAKTSRATDDATRKAIEFNRRVAEMKQNFSAAAQTLYVALIPHIEKLIPLLERFANWITTHGPQIDKFFTDTADEINKIVDAVGGWHNVMTGLLVFIGGKWLLGITSALGGVKGAMLALGRIGMIAGLVELQKYAEKLENKYAWLKHNTWSDTLNDLPGSGFADKAGKSVSKWSREYLGFGFREDDGYKDAKNTSKDAPRGIRNNNPGNLNYAGQSGATKESGDSGRFAVFSSMSDGVAALYRQLQLYMKRGVNTIESIVNKYAPAGDGNNVSAYIQKLVGATGKGANDQLSAEDNGTIFKLMRGIINHENGQRDDGKGYVTDQDILTGIQVGATATAMRQTSMQSTQQQGSKTEINIGEMNMQTSASSANALGEDVQRNVVRNRLVTPMMSGQG